MTDKGATAAHVLKLTNGAAGDLSGFSWIQLSRGDGDYLLPVRPKCPDHLGPLPDGWPSDRRSQWVAKLRTSRVYIPTPLSPGGHGFLLQLKAISSNGACVLSFEKVWYWDPGGASWSKWSLNRLTDWYGNWPCGEVVGVLPAGKSVLPPATGVLRETHGTARFSVFWSWLDGTRRLAEFRLSFFLRWRRPNAILLPHPLIRADYDPRTNTRIGRYLRAIPQLGDSWGSARQEHHHWQVSYAPVSHYGLNAQVRQAWPLAFGVQADSIISRNDGAVRAIWQVSRVKEDWEASGGVLLPSVAEPSTIGRGKDVVQQRGQPIALRSSGPLRLVPAPSKTAKRWTVDLYGSSFLLCLVKDAAGKAIKDGKGNAAPHLLSAASAARVELRFTGNLTLNLDGVRLDVEVAAFAQSVRASRQKLRLTGAVKGAAVLYDTFAQATTFLLENPLKDLNFKLAEDWDENSGRRVSVLLTVPKDASSGTREVRAVSISGAPFGIVQSKATFSAAPGSVVASFVETPGKVGEWQFATDRGEVTLLLPPQAIGEEMIKESPEDNAKEETRFFQSRLSPVTTLAVDLTDIDSARAEPPWSVASFLGRRIGSTGARFVEGNWETFYGVTTRFDSRSPGAPHLRLQEWSAQIGRIPLRIENEEEGSKWPESDNTPAASPESNDALTPWLKSNRALAALAQTRLAEYPVCRAEDLRKPAALDSNAGLSALLRASRRTADPLESERVWWREQPPQDAPPQDAPPQDAPPGPFLRGGPDYGIESRNIHNAIVERAEDLAGTKPTRDVPAHFVSLDSLRFGPFGATGNQRVAFDQGKSWYISEATQGRLDKLTIVRIGRIAGLWNQARHVIVYERRTRSSNQIETGYEDRAALRKVEEFVELTEVERRYPESGSAQDSMCAGPLRGAAFATPRIRVDGSLGRDIPGGWICPLREVAEESKGVAHLLMARSDEKGGGVVPHQVDDCGTLSFFTSTDKRDAADPDKWPAVLGVDIVPEVPVPKTAFCLDVLVADEKGNYGFQPPPQSAELLQSALSIRVRRPTEATAICYARGIGMEAFVDRVTIGRGSFPLTPKLIEAGLASQGVAVLSELLALDYQRLAEETQKKWLENVNDGLKKESSFRKLEAMLAGQAADTARLNVENGLNALRREVEMVRGLLDELPDSKDFEQQARPIWEQAKSRLETASAGITRISLNIEGVVATGKETLAACRAATWEAARAEARSFLVELDRLKKAWAGSVPNAVAEAEREVASFLSEVDASREKVLSALAPVRAAITALPNEQKERLQRELAHVEPLLASAVAECKDSELHALSETLGALKNRLADLLLAGHLRTNLEKVLQDAGDSLRGFTGPSEKSLRRKLVSLQEQLAASVKEDVDQLVGSVCGAHSPKNRRDWEALRASFQNFPTQKFCETLEAQVKALKRVVKLDDLKLEFGFTPAQVTELARKLHDRARMMEREWTEAQLAAATRMDSAARTAIRTIRLHGTPPITETLAFGRQAVAYYYKEAQSIVDFTESTVTFARNLESAAARHAVQLKVRAKALGDELATTVEKDAKKVLGSFAGLTKLIGADLFPRLSFPSVDRPSWLTIQHGQDPQRLTAWTKLRINANRSVLGESPTLLAIGPARIALKNPRLLGRSDVTLGKDGARREQTSASLKADWTVELAGKMLFVLGGAELKMNEQGRLAFNFSPNNLRLSPELSIFSNVMAALNPGQENGFALTSRPSGVRASYDLALPPISVVAGGITNAALSTHVDLQYERGGLAIGMGAWLSRPESPFALSIAFLAGGGYAGFTLRTQGGKPTLDVEIAISAGASVPINTGFMRGSAGVMLSAGLIFKGGTGQLGASMTLALWGNFDFGLASARVSAVLRVVYDGRKLTGRGYIRVTFKLCRWVKIRVGGHFDLPFIGPSSAKSASSGLHATKSVSFLEDGSVIGRPAAGEAARDLRCATANYFNAIHFEQAP